MTTPWWSQIKSHILITTVTKMKFKKNDTSNKYHIKVTQFIINLMELNEIKPVWCWRRNLLRSSSCRSGNMQMYLLSNPARVLQLLANACRCWWREVFVLCAQNRTSSITGKNGQQTLAASGNLILISALKHAWHPITKSRTSQRHLQPLLTYTLAPYFPTRAAFIIANCSSITSRATI